MKLSRSITTVILSLLFATTALALDNVLAVTGITTNSSSAWTRVQPGLYTVEIYAPDAGVSTDPCGVAGGAWDTANATVEYSPDNGVTTTNVNVAALVAATADIMSTMQVGRDYQFRITVASVGANTCLNFKMSRSQ